MMKEFWLGAGDVADWGLDVVELADVGRGTVEQAPEEGRIHGMDGWGERRGWDRFNVVYLEPSGRESGWIISYLSYSLIQTELCRIMPTGSITSRCFFSG